MNSEVFDLARYVKDFHANPLAGVITNGHGQILEVNEPIAKLMSVEDTRSLTGKLLVSFVHRKYVRSFQELIRKISDSGSGSSKELWLRPRGSLPFQASLNAHVVMRHNALVIIRWDIANVNVQRSEVRRFSAAG